MFESVVFCDGVDSYVWVVVGEMVQCCDVCIFSQMGIFVVIVLNFDLGEGCVVFGQVVVSEGDFVCVWCIYIEFFMLVFD